jgi:hypothetical protein
MAHGRHIWATCFQYILHQHDRELDYMRMDEVILPPEFLQGGFVAHADALRPPSRVPCVLPPLGLPDEAPVVPAADGVDGEELLVVVPVAVLHEGLEVFPPRGN